MRIKELIPNPDLTLTIVADEAKMKISEGQCEKGESKAPWATA
jgi:hypothetical protein